MFMRSSGLPVLCLQDQAGRLAENEACGNFLGGRSPGELTMPLEPWSKLPERRAMWGSDRILMQGPYIESVVSRQRERALWLVLMN